MAYRMTPGRRAALRKAQQASARKRKGKGKPKVRSYKSARRRQNAKLAGVAALYVGAHLAGTAAAHHQRGKRSAAAHKRNKASFDSMIKSRTGTHPRTVHGARAHGGGATRSNRVFVTTKHGTTSVRRRHH